MFERRTRRTHESLRQLAPESEAKSKQAPQRQSQRTSLINCTGHPIMDRTPNRN